MPYWVQVPGVEHARAFQLEKPVAHRGAERDQIVGRDADAEA
jgi:hypothetical protein